MQMPKAARHALIQRLLRRGPIPSQAELCRALEARGIEANQATISRDLREIGVVKSPQGYVLPNGNHAARGRELALEHVWSIATAGNLVILRTPPGQANPTAIQLDEHEHPAIVGTIAGDDTVFVATRTKAAARDLAHELEEAQR